MFSVSKWNISSSIRRFAADRSGNVAMLFGLAVVPVVLFAGAAIDYTRGITEKERVQHALDATALAMAAVGTADGEPNRLNEPDGDRINIGARNLQAISNVLSCATAQVLQYLANAPCLGWGLCYKCPE